MLTRYVKSKTTYFYESETGDARRMVLIFGDELKVEGPIPETGRVKAYFRKRKGYVNVDKIHTKACLEIYFIDVGQGDATFIVTPKRKKILIDGGIGRKGLGFLAWKYRLNEIPGPIHLDLMVVSHGDDDHIKGLTPILEHPKIRVERIAHNGIVRFKSHVANTPLGEMVKDNSKKYLMTLIDDLGDLTLADLDGSYPDFCRRIKDESPNPDVFAVDSTSPAIDVEDQKIYVEVLGPLLDSHPDSGEKCLQWFSGSSITINGHSVLLKIIYDKVSLLLSGDMNKKGAKHLLADDSIKENLSAHIFKAPHHGSHDFFFPFMNAVNPQLTVISSGDDPDHGHPRANFIGMAGKVSRSSEPLVFSTEVAATFVEIGDEDNYERDYAMAMGEIADNESTGAIRRLFKRTLPGMINIRTDGKKIYAARRVKAGYWWESYGPIDPVEPDSE